MFKRTLSLALLSMLATTASAGTLCKLGTITFNQDNSNNITFFTGTYALGTVLAAHTGYNQQTLYYPYQCDDAGNQNAIISALVSSGPDRGKTYQTTAKDLTQSQDDHKLTLTFGGAESDFTKK